MTTVLDAYEGETDYGSEAEDYEAEDYEAGYDGEGEDFEDARSDALRRQRAARARRIRAARQQMLRERGRRMVGPGGVRPAVPARPAPTPRQTVEAIRNLDLETKVGEDSLRTAIARANRRAAWATRATVAGVAIDQAFDTFESDLAGHDFVRAGLRFAPLLLLSPERRRPGVEGVLLDPRFIGAAAVAGLLVIGEFRDRDDEVASIEIDRGDLNSGIKTGQLFAVAANKKGADTGQQITWDSPDQSVFQLQRDGQFTIPNPVTQDTTVRVTVTAGRVSRTVFLRLRPPAPADDSSGSGKSTKTASGKQ